MHHIHTGLFALPMIILFFSSLLIIVNYRR